MDSDTNIDYYNIRDDDGILECITPKMRKKFYQRFKKRYNIKDLKLSDKNDSLDSFYISNHDFLFLYIKITEDSYYCDEESYIGSSDESESDSDTDENWYRYKKIIFPHDDKIVIVNKYKLNRIDFVSNGSSGWQHSVVERDGDCSFADTMADIGFGNKQYCNSLFSSSIKNLIANKLIHPLKINILNNITLNVAKVCKLFMNNIQYNVYFYRKDHRMDDDGNYNSGSTNYTIDEYIIFTECNNDTEEIIYLHTYKGDEYCSESVHVELYQENNEKYLGVTIQGNISNIYVIDLQNIVKNGNITYSVFDS
jgi:hypothetical protein